MKQTVILTFFIILFSACLKVNIEIPDTGRKIVINGLITTDNLLNVRISKSAYIGDMNTSIYSSLYNVDNAEVFFYQNSTRIDSLYYVGRPFDEDRMYFFGNYWSERVSPIAGKEYKIVAKVPGLPDAITSTVVPNLVKIERVDTSRVLLTPDPNNKNSSKVQMICKINFTDPSNDKNFYLFNIYRIPSWGNPQNIYFKSQDPIVEEKLNSYQETEGIVFSDKIINGQKYGLAVTVDANAFGRPFSNDTPTADGIPYPDHIKTIYFRLYSITEEYYRYIKTLNKYNANYTNPLADPVLVYSNINGGYGIFAGASISSDSIVFHY